MCKNIKIRNIDDYFLVRNIRPDEAAQTAEIEAICFPPEEALSEKMMSDRIAKAANHFLVAEDKVTGKIAAFVNGIATDDISFRDEFFYNAKLHDSSGKDIVILGVEVLPEYRGRGLASELMSRYLSRECARGRKSAILTCEKSKVPMYEKMGFQERGISDSFWGGKPWYEMQCILNR